MRPVRKMQKDGFVFVQASRSSSPALPLHPALMQEADPGSSSETVNLSLDSLLRGVLWCAAQSSECGSFSQLLHFLFLCHLLFLRLWMVVPHVPPFPQKPIVPSSCGPAMSASAFQAALPATCWGRTEGHSLGRAVICAGQALRSSSSDTHECFPFFWLWVHYHMVTSHVGVLLVLTERGMT